MPVLLFMIITYVDQNFSLSDFHVCKVRVILYIVIVTKTYGAVMIRTIGCLFCLLHIGCTFDFLFLLFCLLLSKLFNVNFTSLQYKYYIVSRNLWPNEHLLKKKKNLYLNLSHSVFVSVSLPVYLSVCLSLFLNEKKVNFFNLIFSIWVS